MSKTKIKRGHNEIKDMINLLIFKKDRMTQNQIYKGSRTLVDKEIEFLMLALCCKKEILETDIDDDNLDGIELWLANRLY